MIYEPPFTPENKADARELLMNAMKGKTFALMIPYDLGVDIFIVPSLADDLERLKKKCYKSAKKLLNLL